MEDFEKSLEDIDADLTSKELKEEAKRIQKRFNLSSVFILTTRTEKEDESEVSRYIEGHAGNYYSSVGAVTYWLKRAEET